MNRYRVKMRDRAKRQYAVARTWWRTYRQGAPNALRDELHAARELLSRHPEAGRLDEDKNAEARRLLLPKTRYIVYYRVDHDAKEVQIVTLWHSSREETEEDV